MPNNNRRKNGGAAGRAAALRQAQRTSGSSSSSSASSSSSVVPATIDAVVDSVIDMKERFSFEECIAALSKAIKKYSTSPRIFELFFLMGEVYLEMGDPLNSQHFLKQAVHGRYFRYDSMFSIFRYNDNI